MAAALSFDPPELRFEGVQLRQVISTPTCCRLPDSTSAAHSLVCARLTSPQMPLPKTRQARAKESHPAMGLRDYSTIAGSAARASP